MHIEWPILVIAVLCEILGTASGLGSSILFLPLAQYFEPPHLVMVLTSVLHVFANSFRVYMFWNPQGIDLLKRLAPTFFITTGLGALLAIWTTPPFYKLALGGLLVTFAVIRILSTDTQKKVGPKKQITLIGAAGLFTGWVGTGGALRAMALSTLHVSKYEYIFISSGIDLGGDTLRTLLYMYNGFIALEHIWYIPTLAVCAYIGSSIGRRLVNKISQLYFERIVLVMILCIGVFTLSQFFLES